MTPRRAMLFVGAQNLERTAEHHYGEVNAVEYVDLVTGDGDYERAVRHVQEEGTVVDAAMFTAPTSDRLRDAVDDFYPLNEYQARRYRGD